MHIRPATPDDADQVLSWLNDKSLWAVDNPDPYQPLTLDGFIQQWLYMLNHHRVWMIERSEKVIGQLGWVFHQATLPELFITVADEENRGIGVGRAALQWLEERARREGVGGLAAQVLGNNQVGKAFFERMGFTMVEASADRVIRDNQLYPLLRFEKTFFPKRQMA